MNIQCKESDNIPCKECLVLASCRFRKLIPCDRLYLWTLDIHIEELIEIMRSYFYCMPVSIALSNDFDISIELQNKIIIKHREIGNYMNNKEE